MAGIGSSIQESELLLARLSKQVKPKYQDLIIPSVEKLVISKAPAAVLMFGSLAPNVNETDVEVLMGLLESAAESKTPKTQLPTIAYDNLLNESAWEQGYTLANLTRKAINIPEKPYRVSLEKVLSQNGVEKKEVTLSDTKIRAISVCGKGLRPLIAVNKSCKHNESEPGLRFTLAHELCHLLFDEEDGVPLAVASGPWAAASIEKRANAFAAMFLMPIEACRSLLHTYSQHQQLDPDVVTEIASAFGTGKLATLRHLQNLELIDADEVSVIEQELVN